MGILSLLTRKRDRSVTDNLPEERLTPREISALTEPPIPDCDKPYYNSDNYYADIIAKDTIWEREVIPFSERKRISYPSKGGLYVPEILLLHYCSCGTYPHPKHGYPGFWWFEYGIRNVGAALESLESRGYIEYIPAAEALPKMTVTQLQELANAHGLNLKGKKADIISSIIEKIPNEGLETYVAERKYRLTPKGESELESNMYVPLMHNNPNKTIEGERFGKEFNVWSVNRVLGQNDFRDSDKVIRQLQNRMAKDRESRLEVSHAYLKERALSGDTKAKILLEQEARFMQMQSAENAFNETGDINAYIEYWENIWKNDSSIIMGDFWVFRLVDLYILQKRYDDALNILSQITDEQYSKRKLKYMQKLEKLLKQSN